MPSVKNSFNLIRLSSVLLLCASPSDGNLIQTTCPYIGTWERDIRTLFLNCTTTELYHCLPTTTKGINKELCMRPQYIQEGHYMIFDIKISTPKMEKCPLDTYQPNNRSSNAMVKICDYNRSDCNGEGEVEWLPGNETTDRICKCDYKRNYVESDYALRASLQRSMGFSKIHDYVQCLYRPCKGTRLQNYSCVDMCPEGMQYLNDNGECVLIEMTTTPEQLRNTSSTTVSVSSINAFISPSVYTTFFLTPRTEDDSKPYVVLLAIGVPLLIILLTGIGCIVYRRKKNQKGCHLPFTVNVIRDNVYTRHLTDRELRKIARETSDTWALSKALGMPEKVFKQLESKYQRQGEKAAYEILHWWANKSKKKDKGSVQHLLNVCVEAELDPQAVETILRIDKPKVRAPTDDELFRLVQYIGNWWVLAKQLGLPDSQIDHIKEDRRNSTEKCYYALIKWRRQNHGNEAGGVRKLLEACRAVKVDQMDQVEAIFKEQAPLLSNNIENGTNVQQPAV